MTDALVMSGRSLRHLTRSLDALLLSVILPVTILLMFVYVFGGAITTGTAYINYVVPGILLLCGGYGAAQTSLGVANDMQTGVIDRFRSMPINGASVLTGHVVAGVVRNFLPTALVAGLAVLMGFRPAGGLAQWAGAVGVLMLYMTAIAWLSVCFGLIAKSTEGAGAFPFFILFLPYVSSAFVPTSTMPSGLQWFAEHQPVTPIIETVRGLLMGTPLGNSAWLAVAWSLGILLVGYALARTLFRRGASR
ncbi:ABC transporter permease [Catelliglobosispora koreensis]|uniref:ABC transporter permease n=1 Tax=Catelliglobosispora koreensis TaxID=129052 RepID=UPI00037F8655|nr:ABC transporter permease [Catelliglobosispora koreensis]